MKDKNSKENNIKAVVKEKKGSKLKNALLIIAGAIAALAVVFFIYVNIYYKADDTALAVLDNQNEQITVTQESDGSIIFEPADENEIKAGFIFYPGGKVENKAYAPLMAQLAENGIKCVLLEVPFNLAIFNMNAADGIAEKEPDLDWYVGGHSLGGVAASGFLAGHTDEFKGIVFLAAYSIKDLSQADLKSLSVYGTQDGVLKMDKYENAKELLPADSNEVIIEGGCHAYFGDYGAQNGDGEPTISREEQQEETVQAICDMINEE